ncbi:MAG: DNA topoisomerase family protein, partial [Ktedonobacterales bacterium]
RLDAVEGGEKDWTEFLKDFYTDLRQQLDRAESEMDKVQKPVEDANEACPQCGKPLLIRTGRFGRFISCSGFPDCEFKKPFFIKTGATCPDCGGDLVERKSRKSAKVFYGCANYPTCTFAAWDRPLATPCPECGGLLTLGNGKKEAACVKCGALVRGAQEGTPEVVGHKAPQAPREAGAATRGRRTTTARTTTRATGTRSRSASAGTTTARATRTTSSAKKPAVKKTTTRATTSRTGTTRKTTRQTAAS